MSVADIRVSVSVKEAADILGISSRKAYFLAGRNELAGAYRVGGRLLVHVPTLLAWIESQATIAPPSVKPSGLIRHDSPDAATPTASDDGGATS